MNDRRVLVTGGGGFIGSNLVRALLDRGAEVRVIDNFSTGRRENLRDVLDGIDLIEADLLDPTSLGRGVEGVECVFHQAAIPSVARSVLEPMRSHQANATGTLAVLQAAREAGVERVVYASSSSVYGGIDALPVHEGLPTVPVSPYGVSKLAGELYCRAATGTFGFPTVCLRYFNVFGPRQDPASTYAAVIPRFVTALLTGERPVIYGDGEQSRDFTYIDNVVEANLLAGAAPEEAFGRAFNIAEGGRHSLNELLGTLRRITGASGIEPVNEDPRPGDVRHSQADVSQATSVLGYRPVVSFEEGLRRTVEWLSATI